MNHLRRPGPSRAERHGKAATVSRSSGVHKAHDLSDRFGYTQLAAWSRVQLGTLDVAGGQLAEARALLAGAAAGLRQRARRRAWPVLRPGEADLLAQVRQAQGAVRFDEAFAAGSRLSQREAVAAIRGPAPHRHPAP